STPLRHAHTVTQAPPTRYPLSLHDALPILAEKALRQVKATTKRLLLEHHSEADAERIATKLASGEWTHDYALDVEELRALGVARSEEHTSELQSRVDLVCRLLLEKKK